MDALDETPIFDSELDANAFPAAPGTDFLGDPFESALTVLEPKQDLGLDPFEGASAALPQTPQPASPSVGCTSGAVASSPATTGCTSSICELPRECAESGQTTEGQSCEADTPLQENRSVNVRRGGDCKDGDTERAKEKLAQRKLRNKESARRYREKQVARRRHLEHYTRTLTEQNRELECLHDRLLSLTCERSIHVEGAGHRAALPDRAHLNENL